MDFFYYVFIVVVCSFLIPILMDEDDEESAGQMEKYAYKRITILENEIEELSKRVKNVENLIKEDKEEQLRKLKADSEYLKFRLNLDEESSRMKVRNK